MKRLIRALAILVLAVVIGLAARQWLFSGVRISGSSMADTLMNGDFVLVTRLGCALDREPERGDVMECAFPGRDGRYVKRVVGLPGDHIAFQNSQLTLNGQAVSEPYVTSPTANFEIFLNDGEYFVLGDNRSESYDSRAADMGCISRNDFLGHARFILWPLHRIGLVE